MLPVVARARVLQPDDPTNGPATEYRDNEIEIVVIVDIDSAGVRGAAHAVQQSLVVENAFVVLPQEQHFPGKLVGRRQDAERGDDDVDVTVTIDIDSFRANRDGHLREHPLLP